MKLLLFVISIGYVLFPWTSLHAQEISIQEDEMTVGEAMDLLEWHFAQEKGVVNAQQEIVPVVQDVYIDPDDLPEDLYFRARVLHIDKEKEQEIYPGYIETVQEVTLKILSGPERGSTITTTHGGIATVEPYQSVHRGDTLVAVKNYKVNGQFEYFIVDHYRITPLIFVFGLFILLTLFFGRRNGVGSLLGLSFSILILTKFIVPQIIKGSDPLIITLVGTFFIATISLYLAHGFTRRTSIALGSTFVTLLISLGLSKLFVDFTFLFGKGTEEAFYLQVGNYTALDLRGLLLAGIVIGTLGVLDDITTAQTAVVGELRQANPSLSPQELYRRGLVVGREHIASLVNTLVLAYAGSSLPLFILFSMNNQIPIWMTLNSERIAEEIIRAIIGSSALILAVPISTMFASIFLKNEKIRKEGSAQPFHHHH